MSYRCCHHVLWLRPRCHVTSQPESRLPNTDGHKSCDRYNIPLDLSNGTTNLSTGNSRNVAAEGGIVSVYYAGTLIGALVAGSLADRCGRIKAVVFGSLWALVGAVLQASAYNIAWMTCARVIAGIGVGAIDCVIPVWSAEVSSHSARGAFLAIEFFMVVFFFSPPWSRLT